MGYANYLGDTGKAVGDAKDFTDKRKAMNFLDEYLMKGVGALARSLSGPPQTGSANPGTPNEVGGLGSGRGSSLTGGASGSRVC